jgi:inositol phosphorylceramide mannosyltransferase catalytic subunit
MPFASWRASWINQHPRWRHRLYDDDDIRSTVADRASKWLPVFDSLPCIIQRADFFRYLIIYLDGGLYADIDMISYLACDPLLADASCVLGIESHFPEASRVRLAYLQPFQLANFIFAAVPGHPLFALLLEEIARSASRPVRSDDLVQETTGPRMMTRIAQAMLVQQEIPLKILPKANWNPPWLYPRRGLLAQRVYARHVCFGTWRTESLPWRRFCRGVRRTIAAIN